MFKDVIGIVFGNVEYIVICYILYFCFVLCIVYGFVILIMRDLVFFWCCECLWDKCVLNYFMFGKDSMGDFFYFKKWDVYDCLKCCFEVYRYYYWNCSDYYDNIINNIYE